MTAASTSASSSIQGSPPPSASGTVSVAHGDGIGPEIMDAVLRVLEAAQVGINYRTVEIGEKVHQRGHSTGIEPQSWDVLRETGVLLKGPVTATQSGGLKNVSVTISKALGLFANVLPCISYDPYIPIRHLHLDLVIIRENEEDLHAGIEYRQTDEVYQSLRLVSRPNSERVVRYAFEYAKHRGRRKVTCLSKDDIMKLTDGVFHKVFDEIGGEYPEIQREHLLVDAGVARIANAPHLFDVVVAPNLYGDIVSRIAAEISGSVGLAPTANIGDRFAMFEAIHGSAATIAGQDLANPSGLLLSAVKMLAHLGLGDKATLIHNAWLRTIEQGVHTIDVFRPDISRRRVGTKEFVSAVIDRLGELPHGLRAARYFRDAIPQASPNRRAPATKDLVGVDVYVHWLLGSPAKLADTLKLAATDELDLVLITNRGAKVWPQGRPETFLSDHWCCRFQHPSGRNVRRANVLKLMASIETIGLDFIKTEHLYRFDGLPGFSRG